MSMVNTRGGIFGSTTLYGGGLFDGTQAGFGAVPFESASAGIGQIGEWERVESYRDGVFGDRDGELRGELRAYGYGPLNDEEGMHAFRNGSLGRIDETAACGIGEWERVEAYRDGVFMDRDGNLIGELQAYQDGSLGQWERVEAYKDGVFMDKDGNLIGELQSYQDGSLGGYGAGEEWLGGLGWTSHDCWGPPLGVNTNVANFSRCHDEQLKSAQSNCYTLQRTPDGFEKRGFSDYDDCVKKTRDVLIDANCLRYCISAAQNYRGGDPCNSATATMYAQKKLGVAQDAKWGPKSQAALVKSGNTFQGLIGCVGPCPAGVPQGSCTGDCAAGYEIDIDTGLCVPIEPTAPPPPPPPPPRPSCGPGEQLVNGACVAIGPGPTPTAKPKKAGISTAWIVGGLLGAAAIAGVYAATRKKKA